MLYQVVESFGHLFCTDFQGADLLHMPQVYKCKYLRIWGLGGATARGKMRGLTECKKGESPG